MRAVLFIEDFLSYRVDHLSKLAKPRLSENGRGRREKVSEPRSASRKFVEVRQRLGKELLSRAGMWR